MVGRHVGARARRFSRAVMSLCSTTRSGSAADTRKKDMDTDTDTQIRLVTSAQKMLLICHFRQFSVPTGNQLEAEKTLSNAPSIGGISGKAGSGFGS